MDTIKAANKIIKTGVSLLPDDAKADFKAQLGDIFIFEAINNALGMVDRDSEKKALLAAYAVQEANRVVGTLWREELLPAALEKEYRTLPKLKEVADLYNQYTDNRKERMDAAMAQYQSIADEEKELDIFKGVINGMDKKESERKYKQYEQQKMAAVGGK